MGVAKYQRGSALIRTLTDREVAKIDSSRDARDNRINALVDRAERAESDLSRARRLIALLRAEKVCLREELAAERSEHAVTKGLAKRLHHALGRALRSWRKASALLRLLPASKVAELRAERDEA